MTCPVCNRNERRNRLWLPERIDGVLWHYSCAYRVRQLAAGHGCPVVLADHGADPALLAALDWLRERNLFARCPGAGRIPGGRVRINNQTFNACAHCMVVFSPMSITAPPHAPMGKTRKR